MVDKCYCLFLIFFLIGSILSRNIDETSEKVHLDIHENGYSADDKYKYINECVQKCMQNSQPTQKKKNIFDNGRDNCIQTQCRIYRRR